MWRGCCGGPASAGPMVIKTGSSRTPTRPLPPPDRRFGLTILAFGARRNSYCGHPHTQHRTRPPDDTIVAWHRQPLGRLYRESASRPALFEDTVPLAEAVRLYQNRFRRRYPNVPMNPGSRSWRRSSGGAVQRSAPWTALNALDLDEPTHGLDRRRAVLAAERGG